MVIRGHRLIDAHLVDRLSSGCFDLFVHFCGDILIDLEIRTHLQTAQSKSTGQKIPNII
jgi:hypothetical protein